MKKTPARLGITEVVLRDANQSLLATRVRLEDMLPVAPLLDEVGFWSLESWGGATFDACIRYLGEDPWERLRAFKKAMPKTPQQMLLRGDNLVGYRHYGGDVVDAFVERAAANGIDVFRIFDALNDVRNIERTVRAVRRADRHAQAAMAYTLSPVHKLEYWLDLGRRFEDLGVDSVAIKDMAGLLSPYVAYELVGRLKERLSCPVHMQCHATTGLSTATILKAVEAGIDNVDTAISSLSMTYGHSATETVVAMLAESDRAPQLDLELLARIALHFREVRKKYARYEGRLKGVDARILHTQVPGGMLSNLENQLREQQAEQRMDEVMEEIPRVRKELGYIPLVTPTSQIVGAQSLVNVLHGKRYERITKETGALLRGEYGATPAPVDEALRKRVLKEQPAAEAPKEGDLGELARAKQKLCKQRPDAPQPQQEELLIYTMFAQAGLDFLQQRDAPQPVEEAAGEAQSTAAPAASSPPGEAQLYNVQIEGRNYAVSVSNTAPGGAAATAAPSAAVIAAPPATPATAAPPATSAPPVPPASQIQQIMSPLSGIVLRILVAEGSQVRAGEVLLVLEAMKMEMEIHAPRAGSVRRLLVAEGTSVAPQAPLLDLD